MYYERKENTMSRIILWMYCIYSTIKIPGMTFKLLGCMVDDNQVNIPPLFCTSLGASYNQITLLYVLGYNFISFSNVKINIHFLQECFTAKATADFYYHLFIFYSLERAFISLVYIPSWIRINDAFHLLQK